jgi:hypothetical protein
MIIFNVFCITKEILQAIQRVLGTRPAEASRVPLQYRPQNRSCHGNTGNNKERKKLVNILQFKIQVPKTYDLGCENVPLLILKKLMKLEEFFVDVVQYLCSLARE